MAFVWSTTHVHDYPELNPRSDGRLPVWYQEGDKRPTVQMRRFILFWYSADDIAALIAQYFPGGDADFNWSESESQIEPVIDSLPGAFRANLVGYKFTA